MPFPRPFNLDGKIALVTGAAKGLGASFAKALAEAGADVVCADIDASRLEETVTKIKETGRKAVPCLCDVSKEEDVKKMMKETKDTLGRLDILFNNAGIAEETPKLLHEYTTEEWNRILSIDLQGVFFCAREALKIMVKQKSGKIINIASIFGLSGSSPDDLKGTAIYLASEASDYMCGQMIVTDGGILAK